MHHCGVSFKVGGHINKKNIGKVIRNTEQKIIHFVILCNDMGGNINVCSIIYKEQQDEPSVCYV